jgi:signal transduction histidine kinase
VVYVVNDAVAAQAAREKLARVIVLRHYEGWLEALVAIGGEAVRRIEAMERAQKAEQIAVQLQQDATLGRYMLDMRHSLNNALTSVLGNSELLLLEPGALSAPVRDQMDTIRNMALRMHEIIQRFSSLEAEMRFHDTFGQGAGRSSGDSVALTAKAGD